MHGVKKIPLSVDEKAIQAKARAVKLKEFEQGRDLINAKRAACEYDLDGLEKSARMLEVNPDYYTLWNYRKQVKGNAYFFFWINVILLKTLCNLRQSYDDDEYDALLSKELQLTLVGNFNRFGY